MIQVDDVLSIHRILIENFGGGDGVRDRGALESALARPYAGFGDQDLYPEPIDKGAALLESLAGNHPFVDGNKRTAYVLTRLLLMDYDYYISATQNEKYVMVTSVAQGMYKFEDIRIWLEANVISSKGGRPPIHLR